MDNVVFVLDSSSRVSGTANTGTVNVQFTNLSYNDKFYLRLTSFNTIFSAPNVSPLKGNTVQVDDGSKIYTVVLPTGAYSVGSANDVGTAVANAVNLAVLTVGGLLRLTAKFNAATNVYTFSAQQQFRFVFTTAGIAYLSAQLGFDANVQALNTAQHVPVFYDNYFGIQITADNSTTQLVNVPRYPQLTLALSFIVPKTCDYGEQLILPESSIAPMRIKFDRNPSQISWNLIRPNGQPLEQALDWTAVFAIEPIRLPAGPPAALLQVDDALLNRVARQDSVLASRAGIVASGQDLQGQWSVRQLPGRIG